MEQNVDIPVPGGDGRIAGLQGFPPGQCSTAFLLQNARLCGLWNRTFTFPFLEVACMFSLILVVLAHPQYRVMSVRMVFSDFSPWSKKVRGSPPVRVRGCRQVELTGSGGLCGRSGWGRARSVLRVRRRLVEAGLGLRAPVLLLVHRRPLPTGYGVSPVWQPPLGSLSRGLNDLEPPRYIVMAL